MISKSKIKFIKSLQLKKYRQEAQCFIVEGAKSVEELLNSPFEVMSLILTESLANQWQKILSKLKTEVIITNENELTKVSSFQTNTSALAVAKMREPLRPSLGREEYALVLDDIRDPGNLGTIIRTADWYGIRHIVASKETADFYNPKVINATMGAFCRVNVFYTSLTDYIPQMKLPVYGTFLDGENVHHVNFEDAGFLVIGNESNGISPEVEKLVSRRITIPRIGKAESLNAGIATAIVLDNWCRSKK